MLPASCVLLIHLSIHVHMYSINNTLHVLSALHSPMLFPVSASQDKIQFQQCTHPSSYALENIPFTTKVYHLRTR
ncbi:hypothetical protein DM02DRAFT_192898 [Periconia macrospinosa]|uniref:Uncharacterized protein n=1 Tax=Periconia macrospinosa TaxID=97972 RepID=A0A2V1D8B1_9PLEO|nr:hypothetical protein DM02DRAFT_192898 [Periconia macrospinosa]